MSLLALLFALVCERGLTHLLRLREPRWLDRYCDWASRTFGARGGTGQALAVIVTIALPVLPVAAVSWALRSQLLGLPQFAFAVFLLLVSFGPRDLKDEVEEYVAALQSGDRDEAARRAKALLESDAAGDTAGARDAVEEAIFVQANNRIFGVIFWFLLIGAAGAWLFRVSDMLRRRAAFECARRGAPPAGDAFSTALAHAHGVLAWVPARLAALTYALAGSFEDAVGNWKVAVGSASRGVLGRAEDLLARVGRASLQPSLAAVPAAEVDVATVRGAWRIVERSVWIWLAVIAALVLAGTAA